MKVQYTLCLALIAVLLATLLTSGCQVSPERQFLTAAEGYNSAVRMANAWYDAGILTEANLVRLEPLRAAAWDALLRWNIALEVGAPASQYIDAFNAALDTLLVELSKHG